MIAADLITAITQLTTNVMKFFVLLVRNTTVGGDLTDRLSELNDDYGEGAGDYDPTTDSVQAIAASLNTAQAEPTTAPAANATVLEKIAYLFAALRNKLTVTTSAKTLYDDAGDALWSKAVSDNGTTYTEDEGA